MIDLFNNGIFFDETIKIGDLVRTTKEYNNFFGCKLSCVRITDIVYREERGSNPLAYVAPVQGESIDELEVFGKRFGRSLDISWLEKLPKEEAVVIDL